MSSLLALPPMQRDPLAALLQRDPGLPRTVAADTLSSLDGLPWLTESGQASAALGRKAGPAGRDGSWLLLLAGLAVAAAVLALGHGEWYPPEQPAPAAPLRADRPVVPSEGTDVTFAGGVTVTAPTSAPEDTLGEARQTPIIALNRPDTPLGASRVKPLAAAPPATRTPAPAAAQFAAPEAAARVVPPAPTLADSPLSPATLKLFRSTLDQSRDAARTVIRLGDRARPGRGASAEELASYRLRQQNAEAAKTYRTYLDTLARAMRRSKSETFARQSHERAQQTLGYLKSMLADSQASLH